MPESSSRYRELIEKVFFDHYRKGITEFEFLREELEHAAKELGFPVVKNIGDVAYSFRYRNKLPGKILDTQPEGYEWIIEGAGKSSYRFRLLSTTHITPPSDLITLEIPDGTPEIIRQYALNDEQSLLAIVRYNRLIDLFLGVTAYSLQNHLRTTVQGVGQIEIDEIYVGIDRDGQHHLIPVQAKVEKQRGMIGVVQVRQDLKYALEKFPHLKCHSVSSRARHEL